MYKTKKIVLALGLTTALLCTQSIAAQNKKNQLPEIGSAGFSVLSIEKEQLIGNALKKQLRGSQPVLNDPVLIEYINSLGNTLVKNANDVNYAFDFFIINKSELNAFAFFGGNIGIHSGLITTAENESELASVVAHEISHVTQRHLARRLEEQSRTQSLSMAGMVTGILLALVNPNLGMAALTTTMAAGQQANINYTRGNEKEADRVGITLLANSGFDPYGAPNFFGKMAEKFRYISKPPAMLLTHPMPDSRISDARVRAQNFPSVQLPPSLAFELAKARITARYEHDTKSNIAMFEGQLKNKRFAIEAAAHYGLALSYLENKDYVKAQGILENLLITDKNNLFYADAISDVYIGLKSFDKAIALLERLHLLMPNNQIVTLNYANVLQEANKLEEASTLLQDFLLVKPGNFIAYDLLSTIYRKLQNPAFMHSSQAEIFAMLGIYPKAIDELQTAIKFSQDRPLFTKRLKARILQLRSEEEKLQRL